jgi:redox-sensitive bicupin YhaK (pirin superfamily)
MVSGMLTIRRSDDRGRADHGWLDTRHTFSFADYYDPSHMGFRSLRVINEDKVAAGAGFGAHGHRDMEILSYVLDGALGHKDSMGNGSTIRPGEVQRMSAGTGVMHSEKNAGAGRVHFLQIWILPERRGLAPGYEQKHFDESERRGRLRLVASRDGRDGSVTVHQDVSVYAGLLDGAETARVDLASGRGAWVHVARGAVEVNGQRLAAGDGAQLEDERTIELARGAGAEVLVFDLA